MYICFGKISRISFWTSTWMDHNMIIIYQDLLVLGYRTIRKTLLEYRALSILPTPVLDHKICAIKFVFADIQLGWCMGNCSKSLCSDPVSADAPNFSHLQQNHLQLNQLQLLFCHLQLQHLQVITFSESLAAKQLAATTYSWKPFAAK